MLALDHLLVARDFSPVSERALKHALELAARTEATLHVLYAEALHRDVGEQKEGPSPAERLDQVREEVCHESEAPEEALDAVSIEEVTRRDVAPAPAILTYASETDIDLIALGTRRRGKMKRVLLGSVAEEVVRRAERPVLSVRGDGEDDQTHQVEEIDRILVPLDFSEHSREALRHAKRWADHYGAKVDLLHVIEDRLHPLLDIGGVKSIHEVEPNVEEKAVEKMGSFDSSTGGPQIEIDRHVATGAPSSCIAEFVDESDVNLVVMSSHGRTGIDRFFLGSVAEKVIRFVDCPVLTVKSFGKSLVSENANADSEGEA